MSDMKFVKHTACKSILLMMSEGPEPCLDTSLTPLTANTVDAAQEKHVPALDYQADGLHVQIGSVEHPMLPEHHIEWILVQTKDGGVFKRLPVDGAPRAFFPDLKEADVVAVYEYCNLHGLWKK